VLNKFWGLPKEKIFELYNDVKMEEFTTEIINEVNEYITAIKKRI